VRAARARLSKERECSPRRLNQAFALEKKKGAGQIMSAKYQVQQGGVMPFFCFITELQLPYSVEADK